jgi:uncharacterized protein (TIGR02453 family)
LATPYFRQALFLFLEELKRHNNRDWFQRNKARYEADVRAPLLRFVADFAPPLARLSKHMVADPRPSGGSLFRIHRDVRFSKDKSPYKTHAAVQFRHRAARDVHAPGFYLHLEPGRVFAGAGIWHPDPATLLLLRKAVASKGGSWRQAVSGKAFRRGLTLEGDFSVRPPRGFPKDHALIEDIRRKDFIAVAGFSDKDALGAGFLGDFTEFCRVACPLMRFLAGAVRLPF